MRSRKRARVGSNSKEWGKRVPPAPYYDFHELVTFDPALRDVIDIGSDGRVHVDFAARDATLAITRATLKQHFLLRFELPADQLVPVIPSRVQYLRWAASLLGPPATSRAQTMLDIGTGPSAIYALLAVRLFPKWRVVATDCEATTCALARTLVRTNKLHDVVRVSHTQDGALLDSEAWGEWTPDLVVCNPPFFDAAQPSESSAGTAAQLRTTGGEVEFIRRIAMESVRRPNVRVFSSLIGLHANVRKVVEILKSNEVRAKDIVSVRLDTGTGRSRWAVAWRFASSKTSARVSGCKADCDFHATIHVLPSRMHLHGIDETAVFRAWCTVMCDLGWLREERDTFHNRDVCGSNDSEPNSGCRDTGKRAAPPDGDSSLNEGATDEESQAQTLNELVVMWKHLSGDDKKLVKCSVSGQVRSKASDGSIDLEMKVVERGCTSIYFVHHLASNVCEQLSLCLDQTLQKNVCG